MKEAFDCMPKEQFEFISKIQADMLESTNMTKGEAWDFGFRCWQCGYAKVERKTNADRIRTMSDEELAEFLPIVSNFLCRPTDECMNTICSRGECENTKECALEWLKSPTTD